MNYRQDFDFCLPYLVEGERILWQGRPEPGNIFTRSDLVMVPFGVMWLGFSLFWEMTALRGGVHWFFALWGVPFIVIGLYLVFGRWIHTAYLRDKTFYVVTSKKIIIKQGSRISMHDSRDLPPMDIEIHRNGNGTILFVTEIYRGGRRHRTYFELENLRDVAQAQNAVSMMER